MIENVVEVVLNVVEVLGLIPCGNSESLTPTAEEEKKTEDATK